MVLCCRCHVMERESFENEVRQHLLPAHASLQGQTLTITQPALLPAQRLATLVVWRLQNIATLMNRDYVNVKVDREERPDVDKTYVRWQHV